MALVSVTVLGAPYCCVVVVAVVVAVEVAASRGVDVAVMGGAIVTGADVTLVMSEVEVATMIGSGSVSGAEVCGADQVTPIVHLGSIPFRTVAVELFLPFHHVGVAPVLLDQFADVIAALPLTARAFHAQHVKLPVNTIQDTFEACRCACATT